MSIRRINELIDIVDDLALQAALAYRVPYGVALAQTDYDLFSQHFLDKMSATKHDAPSIVTTYNAECGLLQIFIKDLGEPELIFKPNQPN